MPWAASGGKTWSSVLLAKGTRSATSFAGVMSAGHCEDRSCRARGALPYAPTCPPDIRPLTGGTGAQAQASSGDSWLQAVIVLSATQRHNGSARGR
eukprot:13145919-Alexandrium_andersonii.AAC.1